MVPKQKDSFRLDDFGNLSVSAQKSLLFSKVGKRKRFLNIKQMTKHDIVRLTSANGSITLLEIVDPSCGTVLVYHAPSPYLMRQYSQGGRYLGKCFAGSLVESGEDFCFLDKQTRLNRIWSIEKIEVLEEHLSKLPSECRLINFF